MSLILLNLQSNQLIKLDSDNPLIIGRGNVHGCFDKRVSRNHGRITCTVDGRIRLEALHCNPCFFTRNGAPPILQINKDEEETLNEGDYLGLLPNAFWFKITSDKETYIKKEPKELEETKTEINFDETIQLNAPTENPTTSNTQVKETVNKRGSESISDNIQSNSLSVNPEVNSSSSSKGFGTPEFEKTRKLPLWMYEIDEATEKNKSPNKRSRTSSEETTKKKQKPSPEPQIKIEDEINVLDAPSTSRVDNIENSSEQTPESQTEGETSKTQGESSNLKIKKEGYESDVNTDGMSSRPICQYENNCYRKNPQHKLDYSHPGDADYLAYEERPLCPYGGACYRRNEQHKVQYRHPPPGSTSHNISSPSSGSRSSIGEERPPCLSGSSCSNQNAQHRKDLYHPPKASSPLPAKRRRKKVKRGNSDYEDDCDEYDLEDPFINDDSSDEFVPSDLESEEEGDLDTSRGDD